MLSSGSEDDDDSLNVIRINEDYKKKYEIRKDRDERMRRKTQRALHPLAIQRRRCTHEHVHVCACLAVPATLSFSAVLCHASHLVLTFMSLCVLCLCV